jgi:hypothetical protein
MLQAFISRRNKSEKNVKGVNNPSLFEEMEPDHVLVPILHCLMGIVDKFLETLITWIYLKVLKIEDPTMNEYRAATLES